MFSVDGIEWLRLSRELFRMVEVPFQIKFVVDFFQFSSHHSLLYNYDVINQNYLKTYLTNKFKCNEYKINKKHEKYLLYRDTLFTF